MTFPEHMAEVVNEALQQGVPPPEVVYTLDMLALELKQRILRTAALEAAEPKPSIIIGKPEILEGLGR